MIAEEYGYEIRPGTALDTPGVEEILSRRERGLRWGVLAFAAEVAILAVAVATGGPSSPQAVAALVVLGPVSAVTVGLMWLWRRARRKERLILSTYGWQVWPCAARQVRVVSAEGRREQGRRWGAEGRVVLMQPDGQSHCSFPSPWEGWDGPRPAGSSKPGDQVWFAGDTRFGGVLAAPGGLPFRYVTRTKPAARPGTATEDEAARKAGLMPRTRRR